MKKHLIAIVFFFATINSCVSGIKPLPLPPVIILSQNIESIIDREEDFPAFVDKQKCSNKTYDQVLRELNNGVLPLNKIKRLEILKITFDYIKKHNSSLDEINCLKKTLEEILKDKLIYPASINNLLDKVQTLKENGNLVEIELKLLNIINPALERYNLNPERLNPFVSLNCEEIIKIKNVWLKYLNQEKIINFIINFLKDNVIDPKQSLEIKNSFCIYSILKTENLLS